MINTRVLRLLGISLAAVISLGCGNKAAPPLASPEAPAASPVPATSGVVPTPSPAAVPSSPTTATSPAEAPAEAGGPVENGWTVCDNPKDGFALALPPSWQKVDLDLQTFNATLAGIEQKNPQAATLMRNARNQISSGAVKLLGLDLSPAAVATGFATNVNVLKEHLPNTMSLDAYVPASLAQLQLLPSVPKPVAHRRVRLYVGDAERFQYSMNLSLPNGQTLQTAPTQLAVIKESDAFVITCTTTVGQAATYANTFDRIGATFRFTK